METYGSRPELTLRKGLAEIGRGKSENVAPDVNKVPARKLTNREAFFNKVSARLRDATEPQRQDMHRLAQLLEWRDLVAAKRVQAGEVSLLHQDGRLRLECRLPEPIHGQAVPPEQALQGLEPIYVQDAPGLNNLDWNAGIRGSLQQVVSANLGKVIRLPRGDIAHFNPAYIYAPQAAPAAPAAKFRCVRPTTLTAPRGYIRFATDEKDDEKKGRRHVYIAPLGRRKELPRGGVPILDTPNRIKKQLPRCNRMALVCEYRRTGASGGGLVGGGISGGAFLGGAFLGGHFWGG